MLGELLSLRKKVLMKSLGELDVLVVWINMKEFLNMPI
jgi:hypothetical protein